MNFILLHFSDLHDTLFIRYYVHIYYIYIFTLNTVEYFLNTFQLNNAVCAILYMLYIYKIIKHVNIVYKMYIIVQGVQIILEKHTIFSTSKFRAALQSKQ